MKNLCVLAFMLCLGINSQANAGLIASWTFESSAPTSAGPHAAELGMQSGTAVATASPGAAAAFSSPAGNGSNRSFQMSQWTAVGKFFQFQVNLTGFTNATISWDQVRSATGPTNFSVQISTDGVNFSNVSSYVVQSGTWTSGASQAAFLFAPISLTSAVDNQSTAFVRFRSDAAAASIGGTTRIDNVTIMAQAVPEPSSLALLGATVVGVMMVSSRRGR